jgi:hypothetical protein
MFRASHTAQYHARTHSNSSRVVRSHWRPPCICVKICLRSGYRSRIYKNKHYLHLRSTLAVYHTSNFFPSCALRAEIIVSRTSIHTTPAAGGFDSEWFSFVVTKEERRSKVNSGVPRPLWDRLPIPIYIVLELQFVNFGTILLKPLWRVFPQYRYPLLQLPLLRASSTLLFAAAIAAKKTTRAGICILTKQKVLNGITVRRSVLMENIGWKDEWM